MTVQKLKELIKNQTVSDDFLILLCSQNHFLANQYVEAIANIKNARIIPIESIYEPKQSALSLVMDFENNLNVLVAETFDERAENYGQFTNTIVICDKIDKKLEAAVADYLVKIPPLEDWCIKDCIKMLCPKLNQESVDWLYYTTLGDIYRITNEIDKLTLFDSAEHQVLLNELRCDPNTDLYVLGDSFALPRAIAQRNKANLLDFLEHIKTYRFDEKTGGVQGIVTNTLTKYIIAAYTFLPSNVNLEAEGLRSQSYYIKKELNGISKDYLLKAIEFLSGINQRLVTGQLDLSDDKFIEYVICHLMGL